MIRTHKERAGLLIFMSGLPGVGKSTVTRQLQNALNGHAVLILQSDRIRKQLYPSPTYTTEESEAVHQTIKSWVLAALHDDQIIIYDATNLQQAHRAWAWHAGEVTNSHVVVVYVTADEGEVRSRLARRIRGESESDADFNIYGLLAASAEPFVCEHFVVDTQRDSGFREVMTHIQQLLAIS